MWIDAHLHLDSPDFDPDRGEVVSRAAAAGVGLMVTAATTLDGAARAIALTSRYPGVHAAVGIYPEYAAAVDASAIEALERLAGSPAVVAIGEIGLDYARVTAPAAVQRRAFEAQLRLARRLNLPVVVHDRDAHGDIEQLLLDEGMRRVMLHCFTGPPEMAVRCAQAGWMISLAGPVTYRNAGALRDVARDVPEDRLLVETDAPYLSPVPVRGRRCEPAFVVHTARAIAGLRGVPSEVFEAALARNACRFFDLHNPTLHKEGFSSDNDARPPERT